jgi:hypothetical protein
MMIIFSNLFNLSWKGQCQQIHITNELECWCWEILYLFLNLMEIILCGTMYGENQ